MRPINIQKAQPYKKQGSGAKLNSMAAGTPRSKLGKGAFLKEIAELKQKHRDEWGIPTERDPEEEKLNMIAQDLSTIRGSYQFSDMAQRNQEDEYMQKGDFLSLEKVFSYH